MLNHTLTRSWTIDRTPSIAAIAATLIACAGRGVGEPRADVQALDVASDVPDSSQSVADVPSIDAPNADSVPMDATPDDACADGGCVAETCASAFHRVGAACVANGGVRPIAPISLGDTTLLRPTLRFALPIGADGAVIELCRDRACATVIERLRVEGASAVPSVALPRSSVVFWRGRARVGETEDTDRFVGPTWLFHTPARDNSEAIDTSSNPHLDLNGDGFDDVVVGSPTASPLGRFQAGVISIFPGSAAGIAGSPARVRAGADVVYAFGSCVASAGDVNGDGFGDVVVGSPSASPSFRISTGAADVYYGGPSGVAPAPARHLEGAAQNSVFGSAVAGLGDVDGDGYADVAIAAFGESPGGMINAGAVRVYVGSIAGIGPDPAITLEGTVAGGRFGASVAGAGDVNGDGFSDLLVGASSVLVAGSGGGLARVYHGSRRGLSNVASTEIGAIAREFQFGRSVAGAGDINGDGFADIVVGAPDSAAMGDSRVGVAVVYQGSRTGIVEARASTLAGSGGAFGYSVSSAGDVNADGFADVIVGAPLAHGRVSSSVGTASVYLGAATGVVITAVSTFEGLASFDRFGAAVSDAGDVNGDGFADIVVGAPGVRVSGVGDVGSATVLHGSAMGVRSAPAQTLLGLAANDAFGTAVACIESELVIRRGTSIPRRGIARRCDSRSSR